MIATLNRNPTHEIVQAGLEALRNMEHRGASGAEVNSGDGAGILIQIPDRFLRHVVDFDLPAAGHYATGIAFIQSQAYDEELLAQIAKEEGVTILGWRDLPTDPRNLGKTAISAMPIFRQIFIAAQDGSNGMTLERIAFCFRKRVEHALPIYFPSLSSRTLVYKGMLTTGQLQDFFPDLSDERLASALALVHSRFSTNTFPSWPLAHPYRYIAHNGEINTVKGNNN